MASRVFPGNSSNGVPYTHFDDLTEMILLLLNRRKEIPKDLVLICCEEDSITYRELQTELGRLIHGVKKWPMLWVPKWFAKIGSWVQNNTPFMPKPFIKPWMVDLADDNYQFTMERAKEVLGWTPKHSLRKTLPKLVENMKSDPIAWYKRHKIPLPCSLKHKKKEK